MNTTHASINSWTIIILGITGDLARKKILPALYSLVSAQIKSQQKSDFILIGAAKDHTTMRTIIEHAQHGATENENGVWAHLKNNSYYYALDFKNPQDFQELAGAIKKHEQTHNLPGNRLIYLATAADFYCVITEHLAQVGIIERQTNLAIKNIQQKIVYEKPFGWDLESAHTINMCIKKYLDERQIYRVDHYLTKTLVSSLALIRFSNILFEPIWNAQYIDHVQIVFNETLGIDSRGSFYDKYGALKDVMQNHMLQLLSLIAMECPQSLDGNAISQAKAAVLKNTQVSTGLLGQYQNYHNEKQVRPDSTTETFAVLKCFIDAKRWQGTPFYLKTGKCLQRKTTDIHIVFKPISQTILGKLGTFEPNIITIRITPDSGFSVTLNAQSGKLGAHPESVVANFCYSCTFSDAVVPTYEKLLLDILDGDTSVTVHSDEIEYAWHIIEQVYTLHLPLYNYACATQGPQEADVFARDNGIVWLS